MPTPRIYLDRLTSLRFFAAMVVVLNHVTRDVATIPGLSNLAELGTTGVGFFFALSGFILMWSHNPADGLRRFYRKRFARVYPLHIVTFFGSIVVLLVTDVGFTIMAAAMNIFLLQSWVPNTAIYFGMNAPSWSLSCEALFYLAFPLTAPLVRRLSYMRTRWMLIGILVAYAAIAVSVTVLLSSGGASRFLLYVFPPFRFLGFLAGVLLAHYMSLGWRPKSPLWVPFASVCAAYPLIFASQEWSGIRWGHGVQDALLLPLILWIIAVAATADLDQKPGFLRSKPLRLLGEWSFALYLTHWLLSVLVGHYLPGLADFDVSGRILTNIAFIVTAIAVAAAAYYAIERPAERWLRGAHPRPAMADADRELQGRDATAGP